MNTLTIAEAGVVTTVGIADDKPSKFRSDLGRAAAQQALESIGSEDITIRRSPQNDATTPAAGQNKGVATKGRSSIHYTSIVAGLMLVSLVGCGTTTGDRAISGAGIGAGAGAILGTVTGMGPGTGAAIGAAAGAATGGLTKKKQINLGKPVWR